MRHASEQMGINFCADCIEFIVNKRKYKQEVGFYDWLDDGAIGTRKKSTKKMDLHLNGTRKKLNTEIQSYFFYGKYNLESFFLFLKKKYNTKINFLS
jgi:hypothetical protein